MALGVTNMVSKRLFIKNLQTQKNQDILRFCFFKVRKTEILDFQKCIFKDDYTQNKDFFKKRNSRTKILTVSDFLRIIVLRQKNQIFGNIFKQFIIFHKFRDTIRQKKTDFITETENSCNIHLERKAWIINKYKFFHRSISLKKSKTFRNHKSWILSQIFCLRTVSLNLFLKFLNIKNFFEFVCP